MRLLNSRTLQMQEFIADEEIPPYAILSHTWDKGEVSLLDMGSPNVSKMRGFKKIKLCCAQAASDNLEWAWVDTCCIDKRSSAELSEAINSMYRWYQQAVVCYAFLEDVYWSDAAEIEARIKHSRWFTRGWTLQELIAPRTVRFFSREWKQLGTKSQLTSTLSSITEIDPDYLNGKDVRQASISKRMSWASGRKTTRTEDVAYSLLGIFDINMPLIYGEGKRAFRRLQEEILKAQPYEHTLFAWGYIIRSPDMLSIPALFGEKEFNGKGQSLWSENDAESQFLGLLAESPADFKHTGCYVPSGVSQRLYSSSHGPLAVPIAMNNGLSVELPQYPGFRNRYGVVHWNRPKLVQIWPCRYLTLLCHLENFLQTDCYLIIPVWKGERATSRSRYLIHESTPKTHVLHDELSTRTKWFIAPQPKVEVDLRTGDVVFLRQPASTASVTRQSRFRLKLENWSKSVERSDILGLFRIRDRTQGEHIIFQWCFQQDGHRDRGWMAIVFREWSAYGELEPLQISIVRVTWGELNAYSTAIEDNELWYPFPRQIGFNKEFIAGEWPPDSDRPCCSHQMAIPQDSWTINGGKYLPIVQVVTERRWMDNGDVVDFVDFQAPDVNPNSEYEMTI